MAINSQMVQKGLDLGMSHFGRVPLAMEKYELPNPVTVGRFGVSAEMSTTADGGDLIKQTRTVGGGITP